MKNPFMLRKEHEKAISKKDLAFYRQRQLDKKHHEDCAYKIRTELRRVLDKLVKVNISHLIDSMDTWRLVLDFDPQPILFALERGDDHFMIDMIAEEIKHKVIRQLISLNIQRPEKFGLER
jgi:hypothetical protein